MQVKQLNTGISQCLPNLAHTEESLHFRLTLASAASAGAWTSTSGTTSPTSLPPPTTVMLSAGLATLQPSPATACRTPWHSPQGLKSWHLAGWIYSLKNIWLISNDYVFLVWYCTEFGRPLRQPTEDSSAGFRLRNGHCRNWHVVNVQLNKWFWQDIWHLYL